MKTTIYTTASCQFSTDEKNYLAAHNIPYEEKNLESNRDFLTEMLAVSNNFAGTPVTKIEKDDGQITVLKGFTKEEFATALGLPAETTAPSTPVASEPMMQTAPATMDAPTPTTPTPIPEPVSSPPPTPSAPAEPEPPSVIPSLPTTAAEAVIVAPPAEPTAPAPVDHPLKAVLNDWPAKSPTADDPMPPPAQPTAPTPTNDLPTTPTSPTPSIPPAPPTSTPPTSLPNIPDPNFNG
ncbi:glutaredoxin family protein [Candidatus Roizmanbacteria bacterium]|nr:glutaredoxin family protein [Candidatus Roizmanbacteria bacterium]